MNKHEVTQDNENYELTGKEQQIHFGLGLGYEKHYNLNNSVFYYGADIAAGIGFTDVLPEKAGDSEYFSASLTPFVGFKVYLSKSISLAIEAGIDNSFDYFKYTGSDVNPDNRVKNIMWHSRLKLPYSLTLNFNL